MAAQRRARPLTQELYRSSSALAPSSIRARSVRNRFTSARGLLLLGLALLVSGAASYILLSRQRDAMSGALVNRFRSLRARFDKGTKAEDNE